MTLPWYTISDTDKIDSPALLFYKDNIQSNIAKMIAMAGNVDRLYPHIKTHKCDTVVKLHQERGINQFKCATIAEAELLGQCQARNIVLAFPLTGPKIDRFLRLIAAFPKSNYATIVDNELTMSNLNKKAATLGLEVSVYLDINAGMNRTGMLPEKKVIALYKKAMALAHINPIGFHVYDGHLHQSELSERKKACDAAFEPIQKLFDELRETLDPNARLIAGGTPSFIVHADRETVDLSPGTCVLWDYRYHSQLPDMDFKFGAVLLTRIVSILPDNKICLDLGHKSVASENPFPRVHFLNLSNAREVSHSEEHLVVQVENTTHLKPGQVIYAIPLHVCPTVALYERAHVIENGVKTDTWPIRARDRKLTI